MQRSVRGLRLKVLNSDSWIDAYQDYYVLLRPNLPDIRWPIVPEQVLRDIVDFLGALEAVEAPDEEETNKKEGDAPADSCADIANLHLDLRFHYSTYVEDETSTEEGDAPIDGCIDIANLHRDPRFHPDTYGDEDMTL